MTKLFHSVNNVNCKKVIKSNEQRVVTITKINKQINKQLILSFFARWYFKLIFEYH